MQFVELRMTTVQLHYQLTQTLDDVYYSSQCQFLLDNFWSTNFIARSWQ